jgi:hypothetical protein
MAENLNLHINFFESLHFLSASLPFSSSKICPTVQMLILGHKYSSLQQIYAKTSNILSYEYCSDLELHGKQQKIFCLTIWKSEEMHWT